MWADVALIVGAYLLGSLPHLFLLGRLCGVDLKGDLHCELWQKGGQLLGTIGILGEFAKGAIPVLVGKSLGFDLFIVVLAGLAAVSGQMWPIFSRFEGEKGNSIGLAMAGALALEPLFVALVPIAVAVAVRTLPRLRNSSQPVSERLTGGPHSRSLPLGMAIGFLTLPIASWWLREPLVITWGYAVLFILIMVRRLTAGLRGDLAAGVSIRGILVKRLLYDRSYRQAARASSLG